MRKNVNRFFKYSFLLWMLTAAWWLLETGARTPAVVSFIHNLEKTATVQGFTSTDFRYNQKFQKTLNRYQQFSSFYQNEYSTAIPGLRTTEILDDICTQMVPQGICIAKDYMLVSAYDNTRAVLGKKAQSYQVNNSVLYVLSNDNARNRKLLTTIVLPDINHVGGVAFDGSRVWIAKSTTRKCSVINYDVIQAAAESGRSSYQLERYDQTVDCGAVASFLTYHDGRIWVGTYSNRISGMGTLRSYDIREGKNLRLVKREELSIPGYANGVSFMEYGDESYMAVTTSKGRIFDSRIYFYQVAKDIQQDRNLYYCYKSCKFPPMAEELVCDGENTYFLFESSATCYSTGTYTGCSYPVDRICALSTTDLFWQNLGIAYDNMTNSINPLQISIVQNVAYHDEWKYWRRYV